MFGNHRKLYITNENSTLKHILFCMFGDGEYVHKIAYMICSGYVPGSRGSLAVYDRGQDVKLMSKL